MAMSEFDYTFFYFLCQHLLANPRSNAHNDFDNKLILKIVRKVDQISNKISPERVDNTAYQGL